MQIGVDSFIALFPDATTGLVPVPGQRMADLLDEVEAADRAGLDIFGIGEHHRPDFADASPAVILAAAATRTRIIRLTSAVSVLSAADPVRVFQDFATLDLVSQGRAEMIVGRGSFGEAYPLFGLRMEDYDDLFTEKLGLLLQLRADEHVHWQGRFRPALTGQGVYPRPIQTEIPIWIGVGGTPESFVRAGTLGLPLVVAIIGGSFERFRPLVDLYREAGRRAGHAAGQLRVGVHLFGFVADTTEAAKEAFFPGWMEAFTRTGRERGWPPPTRAQFEALCGPGGAYLIGDPGVVAAKAIAASATLGGLSRIAFQMSMSTAGASAMLRSIELLGTAVAPVVRRAVP